MNVNASTTSSSPLPHHRLIAYGVARELLLAVRAASIRDAKLRDEALRSAKSACLNTAEGAGRVTRGEKARSFAVARAEACEAAAAVEIAALCGDASEASFGVEVGVGGRGSRAPARPPAGARRGATPRLDVSPRHPPSGLRPPPGSAILPKASTRII